MSKKYLNKQLVVADFNNIKTIYLNRYYNLFMKYFKFNNLDKNQTDYLMRKFWDTGTVAAFKIKNTDEIGLCQWVANKWNMYDLPEEIQLINKWNLPFFPKGNQVVDKDVVIGWITPNHKPIKLVVDEYADRMAQVDMVINTNLQLHKMPFLVSTTPENQQKIKDILNKILNNEVAVFTDADDINAFQSVNTNTQYIIDKLYSYKAQLESELLTILGMDNPIVDNTGRLQNITVDQENSNNAQINQAQETMVACLEDFFDKVEEVLGYKVEFETLVKPVESVYENNIDVSEEQEDVE